VVDGAGSHGRAARSAEALLAGVRRLGAGPSQRGEQRFVRADAHRLPRRGDRDGELSAADHRRRGEPLEVQLDVVASSQSGPDRGQHRGGPARVHGGAAGALAEQVVGGRKPVRVVGPDLDVPSEPGQLAEERQAVAAAAGVHHRPVDAQPLRQPEHGQDRGDADAPRDEPEPPARRTVSGHRQREGVARAAGGHGGADRQAVVHFDRPAAAVGDPTHGDPVVVDVGGVTAQRVLTDQPAG
jgi:hypothetical protein